MDARPVDEDIGANRAAIESDESLVRQNQRVRIVVGRAAAGGPGLFAQPAHHEIRADGHARARARAERCRPRRVVRIRRIAAPRAALEAFGRDEHLVWLVSAARIAGATVVLGEDRLRVDDRALLPQLIHEHVVASREVDVVAGVGAARRPHVLRIEWILERERDAVHRHRRQVRSAPVGGIELRRAFEGIRLLPEFLAHRRGARRQRSLARRRVEIALAGDRPFPADVDRAERVHLTRIWNAHRHSILLLHRRIRRRRLHPAEFNRWADILSEVRQHRRCLYRRCRELQRRSRPHRTRRLRNRRAIHRDQRVRHAVVRLGPVEIGLHQPLTGDLTRADGAVHVIDRRFQKMEWRRLRFESSPVRPDCRGRAYRHDRLDSHAHEPSGFLRRCHPTSPYKRALMPS